MINNTDTASLFSDEEFVIEKSPRGNELKIVSGRSKPLSKDQIF